MSVPIEVSVSAPTGATVTLAAVGGPHGPAIHADSTAFASRA
jgi:hypothetical protein